MHETKEIVYLREKLDVLSQMYNTITPLIDQLKVLLDQQKFIPDSLEESVKEHFSEIINLQKELINKYALLKFGETPEGIQTMSDSLDEHIKIITEKSQFSDIVQFVIGLHSNNPEVELELNKERETVLDFNFAQRTLDECKAVLGKYFLLRQTMEEKDAEKKFKLIVQDLNGLFSLGIISGINFDAISYTEEEGNLISTPSVTKKEDNAIAVSDPGETISTNDVENSDTERSVLQSSEVAVPDNIQVSIDEVDVHTTEISDNVSDQNENVWMELGINDTKEVCFNIDDDNMIIHTCTKPKKFGVGTFRKDLLRAFGPEKMALLCKAFDDSGVNPQVFSTVVGGEEDDFLNAARKLFTDGYFKEYILKKSSFENYEPYYVLTSKGEKVFTTKEAAALLSRKPVKKYSRGELIPDKANYLLVRIVNSRVDKLMLDICSSDEYGLAVSILDCSFFAKGFKILSGEKSFLFAGIFSASVNDFSAFEETLKNIQETIHVLVIIGMTATHAKAISDWVQSFYLINNPDTDIYYYDLETEQYYNLKDGSVAVLFEDVSEEDLQVENGLDSEDVSTDSSNKDTFTDAESIKKIEEIEGNDTNEDNTGNISQITSDTELNSPEGAIVQNEDTAVQNNKKEYNRPDTHIANQSILVLSPESFNHYTHYYQKMLASEKYYCATAYLTALSRKYDSFKPVRQQLAYALNDPLANCIYSSNQIFSVYFSEHNQISESYTVAAVLRNYFFDQCSYDYSIQMLQGAISNFEILQKNSALNQALYSIQQFKAQNHRGIDFYADYRQKKREKFEESLSVIRAEARMLFENYCQGKESGFHRRMIETKRIIYGEGSDIAVYLEAVKDDDREYLSLLTEFLVKNYIKDGLDIVKDNIEPEKIEAVIDKAWDTAGKRMSLYKKTADLMGSYRMNTYKQVHKMVAVLCDYASTVSTNVISADDNGYIAYRRAKKGLINNLEDAIAYLDGNPAETVEKLAGQHVLKYTIKNLLSRLDGSYEEGTLQYFYLEFLQNEFVLLDEEYMPFLEDVSEMDELSVLSRIENHFNNPMSSLEQRLSDILNGADDYGSARLIQDYLKSHPSLVSNKDLLEISIDNAISYPRKDLETKRREFIEDLELAQSYGQIDNTTEDRKETLIQLMDYWYDWAIETGNYGFFYKILVAIRSKIKDDAQIRAVDLNRNLESYKSVHPEWENDEQLSAVISQISARIETQNYAAAEDLLNRLIAGDLDTNSDFIQYDYLSEFLDEYTLNSARGGKASSTLQASLLRGHNKDTRGAARLIQNWPKANGTQPAKISDLLVNLGFAVDKVTKQSTILGKDHFHVTLKRPSNGRRSNYKHPISAFGSEAEENGFRVINIFGKMDASRLIDTFKEIGTAKNTLVLLDYSLTLPDRRELARRTKTELSGKTFVVIDRVVLVYLASHYSETAVNRMLMAVTMPFASYQPYIAESSKIMPQEIFMGRKNELEKIESSSGVNIVYGGRQLGKSALLRMARKDIDNDENGDRAILVDIKGLDYKAAAKKISAALYDEKIFKTEHITDDWDELSRDIKNRLRDSYLGKPIPYLLLLMDEADVFIDSCEKVDYRPFDALKDIQSIGPNRFKFVVAGLRNIVRFKKNVALSNNSVLTHLSSLTVTPFNATEARELLEVPLSYLGFRFPKDAKTEMLISTIFGTTNYFPGLLQLYCSKLIDALQRDYAGYDENETPPYIVKEAHIKKVLSDKTLEQQIREKYFITLKVDEDDYYYLIALLAAFNYHNNKGQNGCDAGDILDIADSYGITKISSLSQDKITALMEEMRELNVLQQIGNGKYRFARHSFCQMMGNMTQIDDEIMAYAIEQGE